MWLTIIKTVLTILPIIVQAVRDGRIKKGAQDEVLRELELASRARIDRAADARDNVLSGRVRVDPSADPNRRD